MASTPWSGFSFDGDTVTGVINYDSVTFQAVSVTYQNTSAKDASVTIITPTTGTHTLTLAAGTPQTSQDITPLGLTMSHSTGLNKLGQQTTFINLPAGWQIYSSWPAS